MTYTKGLAIILASTGLLIPCDLQLDLVFKISTQGAQGVHRKCLCRRILFPNLRYDQSFLHLIYLLRVYVPTGKAASTLLSKFVRIDTKELASIEHDQLGQQSIHAA